MLCSSCKQETEPGKFCTVCGASLVVEETAATSDPQPINVVSETEQPKKKNPDQSNEFTEKVTAEAKTFWNFVLTFLKKPSAAQNVTGSEWISGIITLIIFSLLIALGSFITANSYFSSSFWNSFVQPFIQFIVLFAGIAAITFAGVKITAQSFSFQDIVAKIGAYTIPFLGLAIIGSILAMLNIPFAGTFIMLSLIGPLLIVPTFIFLEKPAAGFDRIYVLLGVYVIGLILSSFLVQRAAFIFIGDLLGGIW
ncbi:hypothetical protein [Oceanobacillus chungangensis]|uniref:Zinc ribbon domain-containing protein n=1 Tax=Oceanobacillus chungangensis TaxID=1229152 RepID=A0A3D8PG39_9BACI|nr:hypothetical protein [Oceanobacillus chungangensis]RDW15050.1 hypothetical protein CWR45_18700 [Oceanobacillus chungangensis]